MTKTHKTFAALVAAALSLSPFCCAYAAEASLTESTASDSYDTGAKRISYNSDMAQFSVDIPAGFSPIISNPTALDEGNGTIEYSLFDCEPDSMWFGCDLHQNVGGYETEMQVWREFDGDIKITLGTDADGMEFSIVNVHYELSETDCHEVLIGTYPMSEDTWLTIALNGQHSNVDTYRDEMYKMFATFDRAGIEATQSSPDTGVEAPVTAAIAATASAAVMLAASRKKR